MNLTIKSAFAQIESTKCVEVGDPAAHTCQCSAQMPKQHTNGLLSKEECTNGHLSNNGCALIFFHSAKKTKAMPAQTPLKIQQETGMKENICAAVTSNDCCHVPKR